MTRPEAERPEALLGSSFHLTSRERPEGGPAFAAWGRVARDGFEADVGDVKVDGDVTLSLEGARAEGTTHAEGPVNRLVVRAAVRF